MDIPGLFLSHIKDLGYDDDISVNDLLQVCQGVMKPILQFLITNTMTKTESKIIRTNLSLHSRKSETIPKEFDLASLKPLLTKAIENHIKIQKLKSAIEAKNSHFVIVETYKKKMNKMKEKMENFRNELKNDKKKVNNNIDKESLSSIADKLLYLSSENKNYLFSASTINSLTSTFDSNLEPIVLFPVLIEQTEDFKKKLQKKIKNFSPSIDFSGYQKGENFDKESFDYNKLIDKFSEEVFEKRENL